MVPKGAVLFIHGLGARSNMYLTLADELATNGYIIYLLDIRGHGYSQGVRGHMPSSDAMVKDIKYFNEYVVGVEGNNQKYIAARKEVLGRNNNTKTVCRVCKANDYLYI